MSTDRDITRIVRSWLEEGVTALPDRVLDTVLDQVPATPQRRSRWPTWRFAQMNKLVLTAGAAATVVVVAFVAINLLPRSGGVGGTPTLIPTGAPTPTATAAALHEGPLAAGTYVSTPFAQAGSDACFVPPQAACIDSTNDDSIRVAVTVPAGWSGTGGGISPTSADPAAQDGASLIFIRGASLFDDPCRNAGAAPEIPVGPTVADFTNAVAAHPLLDVTTPSDVTLAGYSGKYLELQVPADLGSCPIYRPWEPWYYAQGPSERWHLWILDVGGVRVVVQSMDHPGTSGQHRTELQEIVHSIQITP